MFDISAIGDLFKQLPHKLAEIGHNAGIAIKENPRIIGDVAHGDYRSLGQGIRTVGNARRNADQEIDQMSQDNSPVQTYSPEQAGVPPDVQAMDPEEWLRLQRR